MRSMLRIAAAPAAIGIVLPLAASAQSLPGVDPVKVKTIPVGPSAAVPAAPATNPARSAPPARAEILDVPPVKVHTVPVDRKGNLIGESTPAKPK